MFKPCLYLPTPSSESDPLAAFVISELLHLTNVGIPQRGMMGPTPPQNALFPEGEYVCQGLVAARTARGSNTDEPHECTNDEAGKIEQERWIHPLKNEC